MSFAFSVSWMVEGGPTRCFADKEALRRPGSYPKSRVGKEGDANALHPLDYSMVPCIRATKEA
jgi:hypothetical protein